MSQHALMFTSRYAPPEYAPDSEPEDASRYTETMRRILHLMIDGQWRSKKEIRDALRLDPDTEITARLRDLRKPQYGALKVICDRIDGIYKYRIGKAGE